MLSKFPVTLRKLTKPLISQCNSTLCKVWNFLRLFKHSERGPPLPAPIRSSDPPIWATRHRHVPDAKKGASPIRPGCGSAVDELLQPPAGNLPGAGLHSRHEARRAQGRNSFSPHDCRISGKAPLPAFTFYVSRFTLFVLPMTIHHEIETLIRARYPLLYIVTSEETRVQELLLDIAAKRQKKLYEWSCTTGLALAGASVQAAKPRYPATREPLAALDEVIAHVEPAVYLFKDLHPFLGKPGFTVTRRLKEIALHLKHSYK